MVSGVLVLYVDRDVDLDVDRDEFESREGGRGTEIKHKRI